MSDRLRTSNLVVELVRIHFGIPTRPSGGLGSRYLGSRKSCCGPDNTVRLGMGHNQLLGLAFGSLLHCFGDPSRRPARRPLVLLEQDRGKPC